MVRVGLTSAVAKAAGVTLPVARAVIDTTFAVIAEELRQGGEVTIGGFAKFDSKIVPAKESCVPGYPPKHIPEWRQVRIRAAQALKRLVREAE